MGLLDDVPQPMKTGRKPAQMRDNFADLQMMGRKENSKDFADSAFADRQEKLDDVTETGEAGSNCCGAAMYQLGDSYICKDCKEYCEPATDE